MFELTESIVYVIINGQKREVKKNQGGKSFKNMKISSFSLTRYKKRHDIKLRSKKRGKNVV
jgi:hypothetical protein